MSYSIVKYTENYYNKVDRLHPLEDDKGKVLVFETIQDAREHIDEYGLISECYYIADTDLIEWIGRDGDDSRYNWDDCSCGCGECDACQQYRVIQDLEMIKKAAV